jgi:hypothetical protein
VIERGGGRVVLRGDDSNTTIVAEPLPDYRELLRGDVEDADRWSWEWPGPESELEPTTLNRP